MNKKVQAMGRLKSLEIVVIRSDGKRTRLGNPKGNFFQRAAFRYRLTLHNLFARPMPEGHGRMQTYMYRAKQAAFERKNPRLREQRVAREMKEATTNGR